MGQCLQTSAEPWSRGTARHDRRSNLQCRRLQPLFSEGQWLKSPIAWNFRGVKSKSCGSSSRTHRNRPLPGNLAISVNTVHTHLKRLYSKLGVTSRAGLVLQIVHEHLADLQEAEHPTPTVRLHPGARKAA